METYDPQAIEAKWQRVWEDARAFYTDDPEAGEERAKFYMLEMLPYPSGDLHMGHVLNYTLGDVLTHFRRRQGFRVLRPMGWDSFGLPAENAAIREGGHPREITERNIVNIERQMHRLGWAIDWDRVIAAHDPAYYRWTQWLFLRFLEQGLAYRKDAAVNWCPNDQTVLANEQVVNGHCDRCGALVEELIERSPNGAELREYVTRAMTRRVEERASAEDKTGVFTGFLATNPASEARIPVWVADYVLMEYGTGAIMAVPGHDERDGAFAKRYDLPIKTVVAPAEGEPPEGEGAFVAHTADERLVNSAQFSGMPAPEAKRAIVAWLEERQAARPAVSYRLRDWLLSRQRYWGCPIPIVHCERCGIVPVPDSELPVLLPEVEDYLPKGRSPLAAAADSVRVE